MPKEKMKLNADSQSWLCQRLSWEFGSFLAKFGVSYIDVVILNCSLCFAHVKGSFQSPGNGSKVTQGHERSRLFPVARAARVVPAPWLVEFALSSPRLNPPELGKVSPWPRGGVE